ncbi:c-type cytochrome biogenesis protein CcmI/CycH [Psychrobacter sp. 1Y4]
MAVIARISHSGTAIAESGDLSGNPVVISSDQNQANVEINQQIP